MNIEGKRITLRALEHSDAELLHRWSNDPEMWKGLGGWHFPYSTRSTAQWLEGIDDNNMQGHIFGIDAPELGLIGTTNIVDIDWKNRNAFHGMMLGDKNIRGKGYGVDAVMATMRYAFDELGLERLDGSMIESNERSVDFYVNLCGWEIEGRKKRWYFRGGRFLDKIVVGITRDRYLEHVASTDYWRTDKRIGRPTSRPRAEA